MTSTVNQNIWAISFAESGVLGEEKAEINYAYHINNYDFPKEHAHMDYWEFAIVTEGKLINCRNGKNETCPAGSLIYLTTNDTHYLKRVSEKISYINISVREKHLLPILNSISPTLKDTLAEHKYTHSVDRDFIGKIENLIHRTHLLTSEQTVEKNSLLCAAVLLIVQTLYENTIDIFEAHPTWLKNLSEITLAQEFLSYNVTDLCRKLHYSRAQLDRLFQKNLGITPSKYLEDCKFRYAKNLLKSTDITTSEIAYKIGYANISHFNAQFKRKYGITPGQYRKANF